MTSMIAEIIKYSFFITSFTAIVSAAGMTGYLKNRGIAKSMTGFNFLGVVLKYIEITKKENGKIGNWFLATVISFIMSLFFAVLMIFTTPTL